MPVLWAILAVIAITAAVALYRTFTFGKTPPPLKPMESPEVNTKRVVNSLSEAIRCKTISFKEGTIPDSQELLKLHQVLEKQYPLMHQKLTKEVINSYALLYTWQGKNPDLDPVLVTAHQDVVPVDPANADLWDHDPFEGEVSGGYDWGRGAVDMKGMLVSIADAVETLLEQGYEPERTIYIAYGHDEEVSGIAGAGHIAKTLIDRGVHLSALWDEGNGVVEDIIPGTTSPVGIVGIAEKGYLTVEFQVDGKPGHASTPPPHTAIGILALALARLEANPLPVKFTHIENMMRYVAHLLPFKLRLVFANLWLFKSMVVSQLTASDQTAAGFRTTTAVTVFKGGVKDNILPQKATAQVNFRILPGQTVQDVLGHIQSVVNDEQVKFAPVPTSHWNPSNPGPIDTPFYDNFQNAVRTVFDDVPVVPYLMVAGTDSRHYVPFTTTVFRFTPYVTNSAELKRMHGIDERLSIDGLEKLTRFAILLMKSWSSS